MAFGFNPSSFAAGGGFSGPSIAGNLLSFFGPGGSTTAFANAGQNPKTGVVPSGAAREQFIRNEKIRAQNAATRLSVKAVTDRFAHAAGLARGEIQPGARSASSKALVAGFAERKAKRGTPPAGNRTRPARIPIGQQRNKGLAPKPDKPPRDLFEGTASDAFGSFRDDLLTARESKDKSVTPFKSFGANLRDVAKRRSSTSTSSSQGAGSAGASRQALVNRLRTRRPRPVEDEVEDFGGD